MNNTYYQSMIHYLKHGPQIEWRPGLVTYSEVVEQLGIKTSKKPRFPNYGDSWFQDLYFWFDENEVLASLDLFLEPHEGHTHLPKLLNIEWFHIANKLTPETFEHLVVQEHIPCLKATTIGDDDIYPPIYCLDHLGIMPRFQEEPPYHLMRINMRLSRSFPILEYLEIWPKPYI